MKIEKVVIYIAASSNPYSPELEGGSSYLIVKDNNTVIKSSTIESTQRTQPRLLLLAVWSALLNCPLNSIVEIRCASQYVVGLLLDLLSISDEASIKGKHKDLKHKIYSAILRMGEVIPTWVKFDSGDQYLDIAQSNANDAMKSYRSKHNIPLFTQYNTPIERLRKA